SFPTSRQSRCLPATRSLRSPASSPARASVCSSAHSSKQSWGAGSRPAKRPSGLSEALRSDSASHRQECLCHISGTDVATLYKMSRNDVAQTLLSVPSRSLRQRDVHLSERRVDIHGFSPL